ncbi:interferon regulatory factor 10 [Engraulis encrasicolus]|uniref:interferon regulatory factor 10 n=1 Tax=Engraulis encrasicolus TaxID=184585 RepID=UPI002FD6AC70
MEENVRNMRLKEWLIAQIDSGRYIGLSWENQEKTMFRIPWKHAAKQDYRQNEDAALFKAWAIYKGKFREGRDKADPSVWKTRLRCALNKSTDFQEVPDRSQLDISEPYKVYLILPENSDSAESPGNSVIMQGAHPSGRAAGVHQNLPQFVSGESNRMVGVSPRIQAPPPSTVPERVAKEEPLQHGAVVQPRKAVGRALHPKEFQISDFRLQVRVFYQGLMVDEVLSPSQDGCFILHGAAPVGNERIYGPCAAERLFFPPVDAYSLAPSIADAMHRLLPHLERGVLVWVAPDGVFIKRFCQGRVYWGGPMAEHRDQPNKLERERTCKLLDMPIFLQELERFLRGEGPQPNYEINLCFGEEFPEPGVPQSKKLITAQVVPLFAHELLLRLPSSGAGPSHQPLTHTHTHAHAHAYAHAHTHGHSSQHTDPRPSA